MKPVTKVGQGKRAVVMFLSLTFGLGSGLTLFYFVHEQLPRFLRASSALLLAPIAIVDGLCYAAGAPGIYGKVFPIFLVNCVVAGAVYGIGCLAKGIFRRA